MSSSPFLSDPHGIGACLVQAGVEASAAQVAGLGAYLDLLARWQSSVNLVSPASLKDAVRRHVLDSAQLVPLVPQACRRLVDLGSGAGFPGLVLAILRPDMEVHLIESDQKKCVFLESVSRETGVKAFVHASRIEAVLGHVAVPDVITARALAPLEGLLDYVAPLFHVNQALVALFPKGKGGEAEISAAQVRWDFSVDRFPSLTDASGKILRIRGLRKR